MRFLRIPVAIQHPNSKFTRIPMNLPVHLHVQTPPLPRNRLTVLFRPILVFPHLLLVGGPAFGIVGLGIFKTGAFGALAWIAAVFDWFAILFAGHSLAGMRPYKRTYLEWRARVLVYAAFLRDEYPPFGEGDGAYPAALHLPPEPFAHDKTSVLLRPFLLLPHLLVLFALVFVWMIAALIAWVWILFTGNMPASLWIFSRDVMAYSLRVEAYGLLLHDLFPSFGLGQGQDKDITASPPD
ncbi:MAG: hypothetical protein JWP91_604 [Fibrobacteres bacterium]|nr:hypothetical protein [Fibrobacterota bacterium]